MIGESRKNRVLESIIASRVFTNSKINQDLLRYLVNCSMKGEQVKEITIAIEFFGRDSNFNGSEDAVVRYSIHNLRKRLNEYYKSEGKDDKLRIVIPKGHYKVEFQNSADIVEEPAHSIRPFAIKKLREITIISFLIIIIFILFVSNRRLTKKICPIPQDNAIWADFFRSEKPIMLVFGDYYLLREHRKDLGRWQEIRDYQVNSDRDMHVYKDQVHNKEVYTPYFSMLPHHSNQNLMDLLPILFPIRDRVGQTLSTRLTWEQIKANSIIYMGKFHNLRLLHRFTDKLDIQYTEGTELVAVLDNNKDTLKTYLRYRDIKQLSRDEMEATDYYNRDYALVAKVPGPDNNLIWVFAGVGHISLVETVQQFTDQTKLANLEQELVLRHNKVPEYFEILFEVNGFRRTGLQTEIKYSREIDPNFQLATPSK